MQIFLFTNTSRILDKKVTASTESVFNYIEMEMLNFFKDIENTCNYIATIPKVQEMFYTMEQPDKYSVYLELKDPVTSLILSNRSLSGITLATSNNTITFNDIDIDLESIKSLILNKTETFYSAYLPSTGSGNNEYYAAVRKLNRIGGVTPQYLGNIILVLNRQYFNEICSQYGITENSKTYILSNHNEILGSPKSSGESGLEKIITSMTLNQGSSTIFKFGRTKFISHVRYIGETGWKVLTVTPYKEYYSELKTMTLINVGVFILAMLIVTLFSLQIIFGITQPIKSLLSTMESVKKGKFNERSPIILNNEIGRLTAHFNEMMEEVYRLNRTIISNQQNLYELKLANKDARLMALQSQINPHFLYNTLACIQGIAIHFNIKEISAMTTALARILRYSIRENDFVLISAEIENLANYILICQIRLKDKFDFIVDVDPEIMDYTINKLILQPIVENAVNHGLMKKAGKGEIILKGYKNEKYICFEVFDNGAGMSPEQVIELNKLPDPTGEQLNTKGKRSGGGIGIKNVKQRLNLCYSNDYIFHVESSPGLETRVLLQIPQLEGDQNADWPVYSG
jgi:two-component system, sensor histidine kinase YesM